MLRDETFVTYWDYNQGWTCWVYAANDFDFPAWMKGNMTGEYDVTHRFNSGDPMYTVFIKEDVDATLFKLKFL